MYFFTLLAACVFAVQLAFAATPNYALRPPEWFANSSDTSNLTWASDDSDTKRDTAYSEYLSLPHSYPITVWPKRRALWNLNEGPYTRIPYCFVDQRTLDIIGGNTCKIRAAVQLWADALYGAPSAQAKHSIGFREPADPRLFCCKSYHYGKENEPETDDDLKCDWDYDDWPADTLAIHWVDYVKGVGAAEAIAGYLPRGGLKERGGRHWMRVTTAAPISTIAHELGHVLGMTHEHNRWDRDDYIEFRCLNIVGVNDIINRVRVAEKLDFEAARKMICEDWEKANKYHSPSVNFIKGEGANPKDSPKGDGPGGFDYKSIMMYSSYAKIHVGDGPTTLKNAVIVGIKKDSNGNKIPGSEFMIPANEEVSRLDAQFVRDWYPWSG